MGFPSKFKIAIFIIKQISEIVKQKDGSTTMSGLLSPLLTFMSSAVGFEYELVTTGDANIGALDSSGNWTGLLGFLQRKEADVVLGTAITEERYAAFDFGVPYLIEDVTFMAPMKSLAGYKNLFFEPFPARVWQYTIFAYVLSSVVFSITRKHAIGKVLIDFFAVLMKQPAKFKDANVSSTVVYYSWLFFTTTISASYSATFLSNLAMPTKSQPLKTFKDVAQAVQLGTHECLLAKGSSQLSFLQSSKEEHFKIIFQSIQKSGKYLRLFDENVLRQEKEVVVIDSRLVLNLLNANFGMNSYELSSDSLMFRYFGMVFRKDFCCKKKFNRVLYRLLEAGLIMRADNEKQYRDKIKNIAKEKETDNEQSLFYIELYEVFRVMALAYLIALVVLVIEILHSRLNSE